MDFARELAIHPEGSLEGQFALKFSSRTQEGVDFFFLLLLITQSFPPFKLIIFAAVLLFDPILPENRTRSQSFLAFFSPRSVLSSLELAGALPRSHPIRGYLLQGSMGLWNEASEPSFRFGEQKTRLAAPSSTPASAFPAHPGSGRPER